MSNIYDITNYSITNKNVLLVRLPIPDNYKPKNTESSIILGTETLSRTKILGTIFQYYSGNLQDRNGLVAEKLIWSIPLVAQKVDTGEYLVIRKTPSLGYGGLDLLIDDNFEYIYLALENKPENTTILGTASKEVGEELFEKYRKLEVTDIQNDAEFQQKYNEAVSEMQAKISDTTVAPTATLKSPILLDK